MNVVISSSLVQNNLFLLKLMIFNVFGCFFIKQYVKKDYIKNQPPQWLLFGYLTSFPPSQDLT